VRLLHRTTRSVVPTEAGQRLLERLGPALNEVQAALDVVNSFRTRPAGTLRLNVPVSAARLVLPAIVHASSPRIPRSDWKSSPRITSLMCWHRGVMRESATTNDWRKT